MGGLLAGIAHSPKFAKCLLPEKVQGFHLLLGFPSADEHGLGLFRLGIAPGQKRRVIGKHQRVLGVACIGLAEVAHWLA